jgi:acyl-CoA synthetase (AMP-forming)/AMP-acid ligase II/pimeloyl-ACP methyl ester carboxylesterase
MKIYAFHGLAGSRHDWDFLREQWKDLGLDWVFADASNLAWRDQILTEKEKVLVIAHSWGCYFFLKNAAGLSEKIEKVFLLNPFLQTEKALSLPIRGLLSLPVLGAKLLNGNHRASYLSFFENMIAPLKENASPFLARKRQELEDPALWRQALEGKIQQQQRPLQEADKNSLSGCAFWGTNDRTQDSKRQKKILNRVAPAIRSIDVPGAGHGLPWTDVPELRKEISMTATMAKEKIGYHAGATARNNVISYLEKHVENHPDKVALRWAAPEALKTWDGSFTQTITHQEIRFRELEDRIARFAGGLLKLGIQKGDRVIIFLPMSLDMYTAMFAAQRIGAIAVFLDSWARSHHLGASAECVGPKAMISFQQAFQLVDQVPEFSKMPLRILWGPGSGATHNFHELLKSERSPVAAVESEDSALITFTTGSTGKPKGANRSHRFLSAQHHALSHVIPYTETDIDMPAFPIFSLNSLATGVSTTLPAVNLAAPAPTDSALLVNQILNEKITCTTLSPSMLVGVAKYCAEHDLRLPGLRRVVTGGAPISKDDVQAFYKIAPQTELWILYGSTEAEPMAHIEGRDMLAQQAPADPELVESGVNVGHISEDIDFKFIRIIDGPIQLGAAGWKEIEVTRGEVGEFICTGDHVCREYYNNPEAFLATKIKGPDGRVWHRTGDLAFLDDRQKLWIVGRVNNAVIRDNKYYFPVQAEILLKRFPFTQRCAFLGMTDAALGQATVAAIELREASSAASFDFQKAKTDIRRVFEKNQIPVDQIHFVRHVPMDPRHHSKVEYSQLRKMLKENPEVILG